MWLNNAAFNQDQLLPPDADGVCTAASLYWVMKNIQAGVDRDTAEQSIVNAIASLQTEFDQVVAASRGHDKAYARSAQQAETLRAGLAKRAAWTSDQLRRSATELMALAARAKTLPDDEASRRQKEALVRKALTLKSECESLERRIDSAMQGVNFYVDQGTKLAARSSAKPHGDGVVRARAGGHLQDLALRFGLQVGFAAKGLRSVSSGEHFQNVVRPGSHFIYMMNDNGRDYDGEERKAKPGHALAGYRTIQHGIHLESDLYLFDPNVGVNKMNFETEAAKFIRRAQAAYKFPSGRCIPST